MLGIVSSGKRNEQTLFYAASYLHPCSKVIGDPKPYKTENILSLLAQSAQVTDASAVCNAHPQDNEIN